MTEPDPLLRRRGPFGLVLQAERVARIPRRRSGEWLIGALPLILGPNSWVSFDLERERWRVRRPNGSMVSTASAVVAALEVARIEGPTGADLVVRSYLLEVSRG